MEDFFDESFSKDKRKRSGYEELDRHLEFSENLSMIREMIFLEKYKDKLKRTYNNYFDFDPEEKQYLPGAMEFDDYAEMVMEANFWKEDHFSFLKERYILPLFITSRYKEEIEEFSKKIDNDDTPFVTVQLQFSIYLLYTLSYHVINNDYAIVEDFREVLNQHDICKENYLKLQNNIFFQLPFLEPGTNYGCPIVASVLQAVDDKSVQRKVKKIIYKYSKLNFKQLPKIVREQTLFVNRDYLSIDRKEQIREFAFTFLICYFQDRDFLVPTSPYLELIDMEVINMVEKKLNIDYKENDYEQYEKEIESLFENLVDSENDAALVLQSEMNTYFIKVIDACKIDCYPFSNQLFDNNFFQQHKKEIVDSIHNTYNFHLFQKKSFFSLETKEKMRIIVIVCYEILLIQNSIQAKQFVNKTLEINSAKILTAKDEEIESKKERILALEEEIKQLRKEMEQQASSYKTKLKEEKEKVVKPYKNEISGLKRRNKELVEQNQELMEQKEELYKLRELMILEQEIEEQEVVEQTVSLQELSQKYSIVFAGGHEILLKLMKKEFPNLIYVYDTKEMFDEKVIQNADYVFFYYKNISHNLYNKIMKNLVLGKVKFDYIQCRNLNRIEAEIVEKIQNGCKIRN